MWDDDRPRVLVVSALPFNRSTGGGITLSNLFHGWPRDRLALLHTEGVPTTEVCERFFHLTLRHAPVEHQIRRLLDTQRRVAPPTTPAPSSAPVGSPGTARDRAAPASPSLRAQLHAGYDLSPLRIPRALRRWLREFRPEVVYSPLGTIRLNRLALRAARECAVPVVPHFMDDWPATLYTRGELLGRAHRTLHAGLQAVLRRAPFGIGISAPMAREYERRYGLPFVSFANCVDDDQFADPAARSAADRPAGPIELVYVGALHLDRWKSLLRVADAVEAANRAGLSVRLTVHAPEKDRAWYAPTFAGRPAVRLGPSLTDDEVPAVLRAADLLLHVESFTEAHRRYARYSLSTKLPQYLAAGRPVLAHGPEELASMAHLRAAGAALVAGRDDPALLREQLTALCVDAGLRNRLARAGFDHALRHHRRKRVAAEFAEVLRRAAAQPPERPRAARTDLSPAGRTGRSTASHGA